VSEFKQLLLDDFVVVQLESNPTSGSIQLPDWQRVLRGTIVSTGPGIMLPTGKRAPMACKIDDYVTFAATAGMDTVFGGISMRLMHDTDVDAVLS